MSQTKGEQPFRIELEDDGRFWPRWACDALKEFFEERGVYWHVGPKRQGAVGAEEVLEVLEKAWLENVAASEGGSV